jgi:hypothetical protein
MTPQELRTENVNLKIKHAEDEKAIAKSDELIRNLKQTQIRMQRISTKLRADLKTHRKKCADFTAKYRKSMDCKDKHIEAALAKSDALSYEVVAMLCMVIVVLATVFATYLIVIRSYPPYTPCGKFTLW